MKRKVRIKGLPKAQHGMNVSVPHNAHDGSFSGVFAPGVYPPAGMGSKPDVSVGKTLNPVDREFATLEAEKGETTVTNLGKTGIPEFYNIGGKPHSQGGTPLNLPPDSFIFSKDKKLKIKDEDLLNEFGKNTKGKKKSYTPAEISKKYNLNDYHKILADPDSSKLEHKTAEMMIENYNKKLSQLALVQESMKGFPNGIPGIAQPYMMATGLDPKEFLPQQEQPAQGQPQMQFGGSVAERIKRIEPTGSAQYPNMTSMYQYGGGVQGRKVRVTGLPKMDNGGDTPTSSKPTKTQNIPEDAVKWDPTAEGYDESQIQPGDYILEDGKWYKATGFSADRKPYEGGYENPALKADVNGDTRDLQEAYGRLQETMQDPKLRQAVIDQYRKNMAEAKPNAKTGLTEADLAKARDMTDDDIINNFMNMQEQVMAVNAHGITSGDQWDEKDSWDKSRDNYKNTVTELGFTPLENWQAAAFQGAYVGLQNLADDPEYKDQLKDFAVTQVGRSDEKGGGTGKATISDIDGWVGNTTIGQAALYKPVADKLQKEEVEWTEEEKAKVQDVEHLSDVAEPEYAPWWLQDIVKTAGAAGDFGRVQKLSPWQATPGVQLAQPTFMDPTRQLAANAEMANIGTQGAATFSGPQAFNARFSQIQGQAAQNVANTMAGVQGQNVQIANQFEQMNNQIMNTASDRKAQLATQLYDKNTIANQQFMNEKNMARQNLRQSYIDAITNRGQAQVMNQMYDQYNIDPATGGFMQFTHGRPIEPKQSNPTGVMDKAASYKRMNPGWDDSAYIQAAKADAGIKDPYPGYGVNPAQFAYPGGASGYYPNGQ
jgi:hypothetical protein